MAKKKRNKKKKGNVQISYPGPLMSVLIISAVVSLGYLRLCGQCNELGEDIARLEAKRGELSRRLNIEKAKWARNDRIESIQNRLAEWGIEMELPSPDRVVVVKERDLLADNGRPEDDDRYAYVARNEYE